MFVYRSMTFIVTLFACLFCVAMQAFAQTPTPVPFQEAEQALIDLLPAYDEADVTETESGLRYVILEEGTGSALRPCDIIRTRYSGYLADGTPFDTGRNRQFTIGAQEVSAGWDEGAVHFLPSTKAILMVPAALGYGAEVVDDIPADSTLYYEIEVVSAIRDLYPTEGVDMDVTLENGLSYGRMATGTESISDTQIIVMDYAIWETAGCLSSATAENDRQIVFQQRGPGSENVLTPMITGTVGIEVGESRQMFWPAGIMPNTAFETISYTVEVTVVNAFPSPPVPQLTITATEPITTERDVTYYVLEQGAGEEILDFQVLDIIYHVWNGEGELIYTSYLSGLPSVAYQYAREQIPGFDEALRNAHYGDVRQAFLPRGVASANDGVFEDTIIQIEILMKDLPPENNGTVTLPPEGNGTVTLEYDYSDAPGPYPLAGHVFGGMLYLGSSVDIDSEGDAGGDIDGDSSDNGITLISLLELNVPLVVRVSYFNDSGEPATLVGYVDLNGDGVWTADEEVRLTELSSSPEMQTVDMTFGNITDLNGLFGRFRITTEPNVDSSGLATDGEVEDWLFANPTAVQLSQVGNHTTDVVVTLLVILPLLLVTVRVRRRVA